MTIRIGDVLYLHDVDDTGFSTKDVMRWWVVVSITGMTVRISPRSASSRGGVSVPCSAMPEFTKDGCVPRTSRTISLDVANRARNIGTLPEPYLREVIGQYARRRRQRR